jgi:hypothetical protein
MDIRFWISSDNGDFLSNSASWKSPALRVDRLVLSLS